MARKNTNTQKKATPKAKIETPIVVSTDLEDFLKVAQQTAEELVEAKVEPTQEDVEQLDEIETNNNPIEVDVENAPTVEVVPPQIIQPKVEKGPTPPNTKVKKEEKPYVKVQPIRKLYTGSVMGVEGLYGY